MKNMEIKNSKFKNKRNYLQKWIMKFLNKFKKQMT